MICDEQKLNFYLGAHHPHWLRTAPLDVSLFVSHRRLSGRVTLPRAPLGRHYAVDSSGFTHLQMYGEWIDSPASYIEALLRYDEEIGDMAWAAPQDWMCEPAVIEGGTFNGLTFAGTGLSVREHQERTVANFLELRALWPERGHGDCPVMPVLQGWSIDDYLHCVDLYEQAGVRLATDYPVVGVGSVCRRQRSAEIGVIFRELAALDLPLHGFGVKIYGLLKYGRWVTTVDSMAWSAAYRRRPPEPGCVGKRKNCANCLHAALAWRDDLLTRFHAAADGPMQLDLLNDGAATA